MDKIREATINDAFNKWKYEPGTKNEEKIWEEDDFDFSRVTFRAGYLAALSAPVASDARELVYTILQIVTQGSGTYWYWAAREYEAAALIERFVAERERKAREEIGALLAREPAEERGPEVGDVVYIHWRNDHREVTTYSALLQAEVRGATVVVLMRRADVEARIGGKA